MTDTLSGLSFVILLVGVFMALLVWIRSRRIGPPLVYLGIVAIIYVIIQPGVVNWIADLLGVVVDSEEPDPAQQPDSEPAYTGIDTWDVWTFGLYALILIAGLGLLCALIFAAQHLWQRSRVHREKMAHKAEEARREAERKADQRARAEALWSKSLNQAEALEEEWLSYQTDLQKILSFPLMTDMGEPLVEQASRHYLDMVALREDKPPQTVTPSSPFPFAVRTFQASLEAAEREAHKVRSSRFTSEERKKISRAKRLLAQAEGTNHVEEREVAYRQAIKTLDGLVSIPRQAIAVIEEKAPRLAITAGDWHDGVEAPSRAEPKTGSTRKESPRASVRIRAAASTRR